MKQRLRAKQAWLKFRFVLPCSLILGYGSCVTMPRRSVISAGQTASPASQAGAANWQLININLASLEELERLPGIGRGLAARIVAHRNQYGRFRVPEHLMAVRGISDRRFRSMRALIRAE